MSVIYIYFAKICRGLFPGIDICHKLSMTERRLGIHLDIVDLMFFFCEEWFI